MAAGGTGRSLALTPTWAIALVCTAIVVVSFAAERGIHRLAEWLRRSKQYAWFEALEKMKEELMLLGFISLTLTVTQNYIVMICLPSHVLTKWTPCSLSHPGNGDKCKVTSAAKAPTAGRRLLELGLMQVLQGRSLAAAEAGVSDGGDEDPCRGTCKIGHQPVISIEGLHQLHIFIFVMAVVHVFYSAVTMVLSMLKIHSWKKWEIEAQHEDHDSLAEITKAMAFPRQSTFIRYHTSAPYSRNRVIVWIVCFFRQFHTAVTRADFLALRLGFITNHSLDKRFNFYTYMVRSMEEEFKEIVGISAYLWAFVICFLLFNVHGTDFYFWVSLIPPFMLLIIGAKLQHVTATLALENAKIQGSMSSTRVQPRDSLFWFNRPELLLRLIHLILFQNAFELATFFWFWWQFGLNSCFLEQRTFNILRLLLGFLVQVICSYSTLPLYALVSQMGTNYKFAIHVEGALHGWRKRAQKKLGSVADLDFSFHDGSSHAGDASAHAEHGANDGVAPYARNPNVTSTAFALSPHSGSTPLHHMNRQGGSEGQHHGSQFSEGSQFSTIRVSSNEVSRDMELQIRDDSGMTSLKRSSATKLT